jgi:hypothetical protein
MTDNEEFKLKDPAIAIKKKLIAQDAIRQIDLAHQGNQHTAHSKKKILAEEVWFITINLLQRYTDSLGLCFVSRAHH